MGITPAWPAIVIGCFFLGFGIFSWVIYADQGELSSDLLALAFGTVGIMHILRGAAGLLYRARRRLAVALRLFGALALVASFALLTTSFYLFSGLLGAAIILTLCVGVTVLWALFNHRRMQRGVPPS